MKRIVSLVLCMALALGAVTYRPPKANAVALEITAALVGKVVGVTLISWGMAWAIDQISENMTGQSFGENVAREIQYWLDEEHDGKVIDVFFGGMLPNTSPDPSPTGNVVLTASAAFIAAVSAFGKWLYDKYALSENDSAVVSPSSTVLTTVDGYEIKLFDGGVSDFGTLNKDRFVEPVSIGSNLAKVFQFDLDTVGNTQTFNLSDGVVLQFSVDSSYLTVTLTKGSKSKSYLEAIENVKDDSTYQCLITFTDGSLVLGRYFSPTSTYSKKNQLLYNALSNIGININDLNASKNSALSVSAPNGLNLPDTDALPEGQGYALELPETNGAPIQDLNDLMNYVVPLALNNPEYVPTLNPTEITNPDPMPNPDGEEVPDPAPEGASIIDYLVDIWRKIKALPETIGNGIKKAFEPDPELVTEITTTFTDKFGWLETIHRFGQDLFGMTADTAPPVIYIHLEDAEGKYTYGGTEKALDLSWYQRYKADVDRILSGFMWLAFLWLVFKRASAIIQGGEMITEYTNDLDQGHR